MYQSQLFLPLLKEIPSEAQTISHRLMLRAGLIRQQCSGIYIWLPLGLKVLKNIENIIRKHMDANGLNELLMPCIQSTELWHESGRINAYGKEMLKFKDRHDNELLFGPTNEEVITDIFRQNVHSYKSLPLNLYQIQWKFRDEIRPRFGVMRGREFLMKDAYSFDMDEQSALNTYNKMFHAYLKIFKDMELTAIPVKAENGAIGGELSHEFHVLAKTGESDIFYDSKIIERLNDFEVDLEQVKKMYAVADEKHNPDEAKLGDINLVSNKGIEVGQIFNYGQKYARSMNVFIANKEGIKTPVEMGCYGIGVSRLIAAIIETYHDDKGIIWPMNVAPFKVSIININSSNEKSKKAAEEIYLNLQNMQIPALYDDSDNSAGSKFATHDLIGSPLQVIIVPKKIENGIFELKDRKKNSSKDLNYDDLIAEINLHLNPVALI